MTGDLVPNLVRSLHVAIALASVSVVAVYAPPVLAALRTRQFAVARYMVWAWAFALSQTVCFLPLLVGYAVHGAVPRSVPGLPDGWRIAYLAAELVALVGCWADARPERFVPRFAFALGGSLAIASAIMLPAWR